MKINAYLSFNGQCAAALSFYEKVLGAKTVMKMTFGESPMGKDMPPEARALIMHARFVIGGETVMLSDAPCDRYSKPQGFHMTINVDEPAEAERIFKALSEKGQVTMPMEETFWAHRFAMFVDQFGTPWMINCEKKQ